MTRILLILTALLMATGTAAQAARIDAFQNGDNDGVYNLSAEQAAYLGAEDARYIGFYAPHLTGKAQMSLAENGGVFDADTVFASLDKKQDPAAILGLVNGRSDDLSYSGGYLADLGTTGFADMAKKYSSGVGVLFADAPVKFKGTKTFDGRKSRSMLSFTVPDQGDASVVRPAPAPAPSAVPLPAAVWLLGGALVGLAGIRRLRRG